MVVRILRTTTTYLHGIINAVLATTAGAVGAEGFNFSYTFFHLLYLVLRFVELATREWV